MSLLDAVDRVLRGEGRHAVGGGASPTGAMAAIAAGGFIYGAVMGSYGGRPLQALFSGVKVPMLLAVSTALCLPSFYVLNSLLGLRGDFAAALKGIFAGQATLAVVLGALAPITAFVYISKVEYNVAIAFNGIQFLLAALAGQLTLNRHWRPLVLPSSVRRASPRPSSGPTPGATPTWRSSRSCGGLSAAGEGPRGLKWSTYTGWTSVRPPSCPAKGDPPGGR
jgi:hypothetical protein